VPDLTLNVAVKRDTTVLSVRGTADAERCQLLRDGFHVARTLRERGPVPSGRRNGSPDGVAPACHTRRGALQQTRRPVPW
jgi:hypothetical protein